MATPLKVFVALLASLAFAAPASANTVVIVSQAGSGSVVGAPGCTRADVPNSLVAPCFGTNLVNQTITFTANPQGSPVGHWKFIGWAGCPSVISINQCQVTDNAGPIFAGQREITAIFQDSLGPTLNSVSFARSTTTDRGATFSWGSNEPLSSARCSIDNAPETPCTGATSHTAVVSEGQHTFKVLGLDRSGNPGSFTGNVDFRILDTTLVSTPASVSNDKNPTFVFSTGLGTEFECAVEAAGFSACGTKVGDRASLQLSNLADGKHRFRVRAKDVSAVDAVPADFSWVVDTVAPTATLGASGPGEGALQAINRETFVFSSSEEGTFECQLDGAGFAPCASGITLEGLSATAHRFEVRAVDAAGNIGSAVARNWVVFAFPNSGPAPIQQGSTNTEQIVVTLAFFATAKKKTTKFTTLQVKNVPLNSTVKVTCAGKGCPSGLKGKGFTKTKAFGTVSLAKFIKKSLRAGDKITVTVSKPNAIAAVKVLTVRASKKPLIATKCVPPGTAKPVAC
ncbi:hypothetical protein OJ998_23265 [Solirubrobacter taibaiensis]|nr:hypothetical protein [Solirubrobacter taibaiensis]